MASSKKPQPGELPARLATFLNQAIRPGQTLLLGLSGGLDSCVLLDLLLRARVAAGFHLQALHVNHGISPNAPQWEGFCAELCASADAPFQAVRVSVPRDSGLGLEAAAREARYAVLLAQPVDAVVLAHHRDDQAETLLLQLLRGAGVKGLAAMPPVAQAASPAFFALTPTLSQGERGFKKWQARPPALLRPLLDVSRAELEAYAKAHNLRWIEDESNLDLAFDRNFLRHRIFPELGQRFPASRATLARAAGHLAEADGLLREIAAADAQSLVRDGRLDVAGLAAMSEARAKNLLRYWLETHGAAASSRRLQEIYRQLLHARAEAQVSIQVEGGTLHRYRGLACFEPRAATANIPPMRWQGEPELIMAGGRLIFTQASGQGLSMAKVEKGGLSVRTRSGGERFRPDCRRPNRNLKSLFQLTGLPSWQRQQLPLLYAGDTLVAIPGIGVACDWQAETEETGLLIEWQAS